MVNGALLVLGIAALELGACVLFFPPVFDAPSYAPPATAAELARDPWRDTPVNVVPPVVTETTCESLTTDRYADRIVTRQRCASRTLTADERDAFLRQGSPW